MLTNAYIFKVGVHSAVGDEQMFHKTTFIDGIMSAVCQQLHQTIKCN